MVAAADLWERLGNLGVVSTSPLRGPAASSRCLSRPHTLWPHRHRRAAARHVDGGARPKVLLRDGSRSPIAKLSSTTDTYPVVKAEGVAMELARRVGLTASATEVTRCAGRDVLLVERFDRAEGGGRRMLVSALTLFGLDEINARYGTDAELADIIRARFTRPAATTRDLFSRIVFNVCIGNIDDHARNHAAFWDGRARLRSSPRDHRRPGRDDQRRVGFRCRRSQLTALERQQLWQRQILNPFIFYDYPI